MLNNLNMFALFYLIRSIKFAMLYRIFSNGEVLSNLPVTIETIVDLLLNH